jgi:hypothetical protein
MNLQTKLFPWVTLALIIAVVLLVWMFFENGRNQESASLDRGRLIAGKQTADSIAAHWENESKAEHQRWVVSDARHKHEMDSSKRTRSGMIRRERSQRADTVTKTLVDTVYASFENDLEKGRKQRVADSLSHAKELATLQQSKKTIAEAYDSTFADLLRTNDNLILVENKLEKVTGQRNKMAFAAILEAAVIVLMIIL